MLRPIFSPWALLLSGSSFPLAVAARSFAKFSHLEASIAHSNNSTPPYVPTYNVSLPIDHFNASDTRTFTNRYWVNDTYYKPGGPVIFINFAEGTVTPAGIALTLAEWTGHHTFASAVMHLSKQLNGVAIGWEHRYYGYSQPFELSKEDFPVGGAKDYQYLSVNQSLEDVVCFATKHIHQAKLKDNTVLSNLGPNATEILHPSTTPWIWVGGSYAGNLGAWLRLRNPEVIYAVWASSAPVECRPDGSAYFNNIYRATPSNCTADMQAVTRHVDSLLSSTDDSLLSSTDDSAKHRDAVGKLLMHPITYIFQGCGPSGTIHSFCNYLEGFDVASYLYHHRSSNAHDATAGLEVGLAAYLHALWRHNADISPMLAAMRTHSHPNPRDAYAWQWQSWTEIGLFQTIDPASEMALGSRFLDYGAARRDFVDDLPNRVDNSYVRQFGGWNMQPSNTMFSDGEFDPWRAFSVTSQDGHLGAPERGVTTEIPKCGVSLEKGSDIFGIVHEGAVHAADLGSYLYPVEQQEEEESDGVYKNTTLDGLLWPPMFERAGALFLRALKEEWLPCFEEARGRVTAI
ncbi:serine carboxypeptidase S28-domain-containing protein [Bombardia bombarda]|uniref:Serine carboxypeptidase S28-domain-containing protein n=1 Tax=Bombardia bombarda TaxID=252184 RepID=A0AA39TVK0_9PEZI|nr:serine carboxypeptidase S28-domain-containing protein [Bombardia bombarda]